MRILLVEDDPALRLGIRRVLEGEGWQVDAVADGELALAATATEKYDAAVLDINLPRRDGFSVLQHWRDHRLALPVLLLTARDELADKVRGLDAGADDYLAKPFEREELLARLRAISRRYRGSSSSQVQLGALSFDLNSRELKFRGERVALSPREAALVELLISSPGKAVPKSRIVSAMSSWESDFSANAVEIYVLKLRRKLAGTGVQIVTVRGVGYTLEEAAP
jgi:DNA-binding response OmpR family regulator